VLPVSSQIHEKTRIIAGRMFTPGLNEVIIGKLILNQYPAVHCEQTESWQTHLESGGCFRGWWKFVRIGGLGDLHSMQEDSRRGSSYNSIRSNCFGDVTR